MTRPFCKRWAGVLTAHQLHLLPLVLLLAFWEGACSHFHFFQGALAQCWGANARGENAIVGTTGGGWLWWRKTTAHPGFSKPFVIIVIIHLDPYNAQLIDGVAALCWAGPSGDSSQGGVSKAKTQPDALVYAS